MEQPQITANQSIYNYYWPKDKVNIRVDRLREAKDALAGEVTIHTGDNTTKRLFVLRDRILLLSSRSKEGIVKTATERQPKINWHDIIIYACEYTVNRYREGVEVKDIGDQPLSQKVKFLVHPLLVFGEANMIYGQGGTCKSYLGNLLGLTVWSGNPLIKFLKPASVGIRTLVLDYETSWDVWNDRVKKLKNGMEVEGSLKYRRCHQSVQNDIEQIHQIVLDNNIGLVIVDSYGMACGGNAWDQIVARDYFMALRSIEVTTLTIDHPPKDKDKSGPFGSGYKQFETRNLWKVRGTQEAGNDITQVALIHEKANDSRLHKPLGLRFSFIEDDAVIVEAVDVKDMPDFLDEIPLQDRIADALKKGALSMDEIADEIGANRDSVKTKLYQHKHRFTKVGMDGKRWGLLSQSI